MSEELNAASNPAPAPETPSDPAPAQVPVENTVQPASGSNNETAAFIEKITQLETQIAEQQKKHDEEMKTLIMSIGTQKETKTEFDKQVEKATNKVNKYRPKK